MRYAKTSRLVGVREARSIWTCVLQMLTKDKRAVWSPVRGKWCSEGGRELSGEVEKFRRTNPERSLLGGSRW